MALGGLGETMGARRGYTDNAGYTRHCWECAHSALWGETPVPVPRCPELMYGSPTKGTCKVTGMVVDKMDSPANPCSKACGCADWEGRR